MDLSHFHRFDELATAMKDSRVGDFAELVQQAAAMMLRSEVSHRADKHQKPSTGSFDFEVSMDGRSLKAMVLHSSVIPEIDSVKRSEPLEALLVTLSLDCCWIDCSKRMKRMMV